MADALSLGSGLAWTATYLLIIWTSRREKTYGMPIAALAANLGWEFIFSFVRPGDGMQLVVNYVWFGFDVAILALTVAYGPREFRFLPRWGFLAMLASVLVMGYLGVDLVSRQFDHGLATFAAFGQNLMMSGLFLSMLIARGSTRGQSVWIALTKGVGTALASAASWIWLQDEPWRHGPLLPYLMIATAALDLAYVVAVHAVARHESGRAVRTGAFSGGGRRTSA
ncbi:transmembrane-type terpene cyclase [Actinomadura rupiterrae]|uniref:transmembrane-type terpene cyclase n=1 Tax=Actinomadura rupiterrae TaxID=559627 RepID=UPI003FD81105